MNQKEGFTTIEHDGAVLSVRTRDLFVAWLDKYIPAAAVAPAAAQVQNLPPIGARYMEGLYAGITLRGEEPHVLILLPDEFEGPWEKAKAWATERGGELPTRIDQLVLFKNLKSEFKEAWYWSGEQYAGSDAFAWLQYFGDGIQDNYHKDTSNRARAVRSIPIR